MIHYNEIQQISIPLSLTAGRDVSATEIEAEQLQEHLAIFRQALLEKNHGPLYGNLNERFPPLNVCISQRFADHVRDVHVALDKALTNIVGGWFTDTDANFPARMPLERHEEELLHWISGPGRNEVPNFAEKYGMWRTDYLVERDEDGLETVKICEINARFPYNGFWPVGLHEHATQVLSGKQQRYVSPSNFDVTKAAIYDSFDQAKPLFHVCKKWKGPDQAPFLRDWKRRTGQEVFKIDPSEIGLDADKLVYRPSASTADDSDARTSGHQTAPQQIEQCSLELFQDECAEINTVILRKIATCCVSDLRTVFITHDKRLLGIIEQELPNLQERGVLTAEERQLLQHSIAHTILPGTSEMQAILKQSQADDSIRHKYIIKAVRDGFGTGIEMAKDLTQEEWLHLLQKQAAKPLLPSEGAVVLQEIVDHVWYGIVRHDGEHAGKAKPFHLIGSYHMLNGKLGVYGPWRIGEELHSGLGGPGRGIVMSTVIRR